MANNWYDAGRKYELDSLWDVDVDTTKVCLIKNTYTPNLATDAHLNDLGTNRVGTDQTLGSITTTAGTLGGANVTFPTVPGGSTVAFIGIYKLVGDGSTSDTTSPLLVLFDTVTGFPVATSGADITIVWNASGILRV